MGAEGIDLTYDIRAIVPELVTEGDAEHLPRNKSQQKKWREAIEENLGKWVVGDVLPLVQNALKVDALPAQASVDVESADSIRIEYEHTSEGTGYVKPVVVLEFGAKSTGEPCATIDVTCDAAPSLPDLSFPMSAPRVMRSSVPSGRRRLPCT